MMLHLSDVMLLWRYAYLTWCLFGIFCQMWVKISPTPVLWLVYC